MPEFSLNANLCFKPLTYLVDVATDKKVHQKIKEKDLKKISTHLEIPEGTDQDYPQRLEYATQLANAQKKEILCLKRQKAIQRWTYFTHPLDDLIRAASVPVFSVTAHFSDISHARGSKRALKILGTPVWLPAKMCIKTICISLPLTGLAFISIFFPYRTFFDLKAKQTGRKYTKEEGQPISKLNAKPVNFPRYLSRLATQNALRVGNLNTGNKKAAKRTKIALKTTHEIIHEASIATRKGTTAEDAALAVVRCHEHLQVVQEAAKQATDEAYNNEEIAEVAGATLILAKNAVDLAIQAACLKDSLVKAKAKAENKAGTLEEYASQMHEAEQTFEESERQAKEAKKAFRQARKQVKAEHGNDAAKQNKENAKQLKKAATGKVEQAEKGLEALNRRHQVAVKESEVAEEKRTELEDNAPERFDTLTHSIEEAEEQYEKLKTELKKAIQESKKAKVEGEEIQRSFSWDNLSRWPLGRYIPVMLQKDRNFSDFDENINLGNFNNINQEFKKLEPYQAGIYEQLFIM